MFKIANEEQLLKAFRPRDRRTVEVPAGKPFPWMVRDAFSWVDGPGVRVFLLTLDPNTQRPLGLAFRRDTGGSKTGASSAMCDWCHSFGSADRIGMLTCEQNSKKRVGLVLCRDLGCADRAEDDAYRGGRNAKQARQDVVDRMWKFANEGLGIQEVPAA